jgi:2',3'-cyclic-nucleotide 2'-phosphodiesterase (5'-nucleotidase family)
MFSTLKLKHILIIVLGISIAACKPAFVPTQRKSVQFQIRDSAYSVEPTAIAAYLTPFRDSLTKVMDQIIGDAGDSFSKVRPGGSLGNLVVDALYQRAKNIDHQTCGAVYNYGGLRITDLAKGPVRIGKIYELLPFENELVIVTIQGRVLVEWLETAMASGGWPVRLDSPIVLSQPMMAGNASADGNMNGQVRDKSVKTIVFHQNTCDLQHCDTILFNDGNRMRHCYFIHPDSTYKIATNDYLANGGDQCAFLMTIPRQKTGILIRDLMIDEIRKVTHIKPDPKPRMIQN